MRQSIIASDRDRLIDTLVDSKLPESAGLEGTCFSKRQTEGSVEQREAVEGTCFTKRSAEGLEGTCFSKRS